MKYHNWTDNMHLGARRNSDSSASRDVLGMTPEQRLHREYIRRKVALVHELQQLGQELTEVWEE